jgi:hypothetical protein
MFFMTGWTQDLAEFTPFNRITSLAISDDGRTIVAGAALTTMDYCIDVYDDANCNPARRLQGQDLPLGYDAVTVLRATKYFNCVGGRTIFDRNNADIGSCFRDDRPF